MKVSSGLLAATAAFLLVFSFLFSAMPAAAQTFVATFGSGDSCGFDDLQAAVDALASVPATERTIRLERGVFHNVAVTAETNQVTLRGGFDSCDAAEPTPGARTILFGRNDGSTPVIFHQGETLGPEDPPTLVLQNIELGRGFSGLRILGPAQVLLEDVLILDNAADSGGGIVVQAAVDRVNLDLVRTSVNGNETLPLGNTRHGGGLFCNGVGTIRVKGGSSFIGNSTAVGGLGGGIYLNDCVLRVEGDVQISSNHAHRGGGIAATDDGAVRLTSIGQGTVEVVFNQAREADGVPGLGGGIYIEQSSFLEVNSAHIENNEAQPLSGDGGRGGGIYVDSSSAFLESIDGCAAPCITLSENEASRGAALVATNDSTVEIVRTILDANVSESTLLEVEDGGGPSSQLFLMSSFVSRNVAPTLMRVSDNSTLRLIHTSVGGNLGIDEVVRGLDLSSFMLQSSVVFEPSTDHLFNLGDSVALSAECSLVSDDSAFGGSPTVKEQDPLFVDAPLGNLHLQETSPALDLCAPISGIEKDIDGQPVPIDQEVVLDDGTTADAGADEVSFIEPGDVSMFEDGFESGELSAWSGGTARLTPKP